MSVPDYQFWEKGENTVQLEKNCVSNSGRYFVNVGGAKELLSALETALVPQGSNVYREWGSKGSKQLLTVFQRVPEFEGKAILALIGEKLAALGYARTGGTT